jgi:hypothetical protein
MEILQQLPVSIQMLRAVLDAGRQLDKVYFTARYPNGCFFPALQLITSRRRRVKS